VSCEARGRMIPIRPCVSLEFSTAHLTRNLELVAVKAGAAFATGIKPGLPCAALVARYGAAYPGDHGGMDG
jgi:hypothetical protein